MKYDHSKKDFLEALGLDESFTDLAFSAIISHLKDRKTISQVLEELAITCEKNFGNDSDKIHQNVKLITLGFIMSIGLEKAFHKLKKSPIESLLNELKSKNSKESNDFESEIASFFPIEKETKKDTKSKVVKGTEIKSDLVFNISDLIDAIHRDINKKDE